MLRHSLSAISLTMLALAASGALPAHATQSVSACGTTCTADCALTQDIVCDGSVDGVILTNGADLNLAGHSITCDNPSDPENICLVSAVYIFAANSTVTDTGNPKGKILGQFLPLMLCNSKAGSHVTGIWAEGFDSGLQNCEQVDNNVLIANDDEEYGNPAVKTAGVTTGVDYIRDNYINAIRAIAVTGSKAVTVDHNLVIMMSDAVYGITTSLATSSSTNVHHNIVLGSHGGPVSVNAANQYSQNRCSAGNSACDLCVSQGKCVLPKVLVP